MSIMLYSSYRVREEEAEMADNRKVGFRTVDNDVDDLKIKIRQHRIKLLRRTIGVVFLLAIIFGGYEIYSRLRNYDDYSVQSRIQRDDSSTTNFELFQGNILKYNNDGAVYTSLSENLIWNQAFEMQDPIVSICGNYVAIADQQGTTVYILDVNGLLGQFETSMPIESICVASQGTIAVLTQKDGTSIIQLYDKEGKKIASGAIHIENGGSPMDIALSMDATRLAVTMVDISTGIANTTIAFYNFGSVGQNEIDNIVGSYSYENTIIPEIEYLENDEMLAFGDSQIIVFEGEQKPKEKNTVKLEKEIQSIFYDSEYFGVVYSNEDKNETYTMEIYDFKGNQKISEKIDLNYDKIYFLQNHEVCVQSQSACAIYTDKGVQKFYYSFDDAIYKVLSGTTGRSYTFILNGFTEKVRIK